MEGDGGGDWLALYLAKWLPEMWVFATHTVVPTATASNVTLALHYHGLLGELLARMTREITRSYLRLEANGLKMQSEIDPN